jgi:hypothetical protein
MSDDGYRDKPFEESMFEDPIIPELTPANVSYSIISME